MGKTNFVDELTKYLKTGDKENFLKRYSEVVNSISPEDEEYIELKLLNFTYGFLFVGDFEKLTVEIENLEPLITEYGNDVQMIRFLVNKGIVLGRLNQPEEAIDVYKQALKYCNTDDKITYRISILTNLGVIYFRKNNFLKSLKYLLTAYHLNKKFNCQVKLTSLLVNIGVIYLHLTEYEKAIYYFEISLKTMTNSREYAKLSIYNNLITAYSISGDFTNASKIIELCIPEKKNYSKADEINFHKAIALYHSEKKDQVEAIKEYKYVVEHLGCDKYVKERSGYQISLAELYLQRDNFEECKVIIDTLDSDNEYDNTVASYNSFLGLKVNYYTHQKDYQTALKYSKELNEINQEQFKTLEKEIIKDLTIPLADQNSNISLDAYDDKISELEDTNKELIEQEKLLVESLNDLRNESNLREKIISIISHDLRAPIGNIIQLLHFLDVIDDDKEKDEIFSDVLDGLNQAFALTDELVDWAKEIIDVQKSALSYIDFKEIVADVEKLYRQQLEKKQIFIINNLSSEKIIFSHKTSLKTCFRNIIQNAIKYSKPFSRIEVNEEITEHNAIYSIKDYGKGIPPEEIKNLFDVSKISTVGTNQESGIGIGLLLVNELIKKNNGEIRCESVLGEGTTFYFTFPININDRFDYLKINNQNEESTKV